jgi:hypothetical protein
VAFFTLEAEFTGFIKGVKEAFWLWGLYKEVNRFISLLTPLNGDNKGAIDTVYNFKHYSCTKYTLLKFQGVRECVLRGYVTIKYVCIVEMAANGLIKALSPVKYKAFLGLLNLYRP